MTFANVKTPRIVDRIIFWWRHTLDNRLLQRSLSSINLTMFRFFPFFLNVSSLKRHSFYQPVFVSDNLLLSVGPRTPLLTVNNEKKICLKDGRKSTRQRQRQMEFNNLVSIKGQKKYGWHRFFRKFLSSFFLFFSVIHSELWLLNWFQAPRFHIEFPVPSKKAF